MTQPISMVERVARAIAEGLGDNFDDAFVTKPEWNRERGEKGGRFRDINEPFQGDYLDAARSAIEAMMEPTEQMVLDAVDAWHEAPPQLLDADLVTAYRAMITAALSGDGAGGAENPGAG